MTPADLPERIAARIALDDAGCWLWIGATDGRGYGAVRWDGRVASAHRVAYHLLVDQTFPVHSGGPHAGLQLDHVCEVRNCCNPDHLEPVTHAENQRRRCARPAVSVEAVAADYMSGEDSAVIAARYGVAQTTVYKYVRLTGGEVRPRGRPKAAA